MWYLLASLTRRNSFPGPQAPPHSIPPSPRTSTRHLPNITPKKHSKLGENKHSPQKPTIGSGTSSSVKPELIHSTRRCSSWVRTAPSLRPLPPLAIRNASTCCVCFEFQMVCVPGQILYVSVCISYMPVCVSSVSNVSSVSHIICVCVCICKHTHSH